MKFPKFYLFAASVCIFLTGCLSKETKIEDNDFEFVMKQKSSDHKWFYFSNESFDEIDLPQHSPIFALKPWTESVRICDGNTTKEGKAIFLVNHLGALYFDGNEIPDLIQDYQLFSDSTAGNLVFEGNEAFFTLVKNSFFNKTANQNQNQEQSHIIRLSLDQKLFFPVVTYGELNIGQAGEVTNTFFDGEDWFSSVKSTKNNKVSFHYIKWKSLVDLAQVEPFSKNTTSGNISVSEISERSYRNLITPEDISKAPPRLRELLKSIPKKFSYSLTFRETGGSSPLYFTAGTDGDGTVANAILKENWICAVFADGTTYFAGGIDGKPLIKNGKTIAFRLPKLPKRYTYQSFALTGKYLIVSWEESDFYKTGRSGFITVDMEQLFY